MAKAEATFTQVVDSVTITLSSNEANALRDILSFVGGCPETSGRKHTDSIMFALDLIGVRGGGHIIRKTSSIYFE